MLKKLRAKPDHIKHSISIFTTVVIFSVIVFVWVSSFDARANDKIIQNKTTSPLAGLASMFGVGEFVDSLKQKISGKPSFIETNSDTDLPVIATTTTSSFDLSGVVIID